MVAETSYSGYTANGDSACVSNLMREANTEVDYWVKVPTGDEDAMKCLVAKRGPLYVELIVNNTSFENVKEGIYDDREKNCTENRTIDHVSLF